MTDLDEKMDGGEAGADPVVERPIAPPERVEPPRDSQIEVQNPDTVEPSQDPIKRDVVSEDAAPRLDEVQPPVEPSADPNKAAPVVEDEAPPLDEPEQEAEPVSAPIEKQIKSEEIVEPSQEPPKTDVVRKEVHRPAEPSADPGKAAFAVKDEDPPLDEPEKKQTAVGAPTEKQIKSEVTVEPIQEPTKTDVVRKEVQRPAEPSADPGKAAFAVKDEDPPLDEPEEDKESASARTEKQIKGDEFENKTTDEMLQIPGMELIYGGAKSHGFDPCFYHPDVGIIVTDAKDFGSEEKPGYVSEVSAFKSEHIAPNMTKMLTDMDANETIPQETKDEVWQAFHDNRGKFLVVGSDTTRMSANKQAEWGQFTKISDLQSTLDSLRKK